MTKSLLVIDTPESCIQCEILNSDLTCLGCKVNFKDIGKVPSWCPLKIMPEKKNVENYSYAKLTMTYERGYNACIDELLGD